MTTSASVKEKMIDVVTDQLDKLFVELMPILSPFLEAEFKLLREALKDPAKRDLIIVVIQNECKDEFTRMVDLKDEPPSSIEVGAERRHPLWIDRNWARFENNAVPLLTKLLALKGSGVTIPTPVALYDRLALAEQNRKQRVIFPLRIIYYLLFL